MSLITTIDLLHRSSQRLREFWTLPHDELYRVAMRRELWFHLRLTIKTTWRFLRNKN